MNEMEHWYAASLDSELNIGDYFRRVRLSRVTPEMLDALLADGWRHFGEDFFRDMLNFLGAKLVTVLPLRIDLSRFALSRSQRRVLRKNDDAGVEIAPIRITPAAEKMFAAHTKRFTRNSPDSLQALFSDTPSLVPCSAVQLTVDILTLPVAISYADIGHESTSSVYAIFDPVFSNRSLGIFTLLKEIELAQRLNKRYLYLGYAYREQSAYDYKKQFAGVEFYNWRGEWRDLAEIQS